MRIMSLLTEHRSPADAHELAPSPWSLARARVWHSAGITVGLYWQPDGDEIFVEVTDEQTGEIFVLEPPKSDALPAFYHPYALWPRDGQSR